MHSFVTVAATAALAVAVNGQAEFIAGNWYTNQVNTIQYTNFGSSGSYQAVTNMDSNSGSCSNQPQGYSGSLAPLNGEVSVHFRGPLALKQFAFYTPSSSSKVKRDEPVHRHHQRHANHAEFHANLAREAEADAEEAQVEEKRQVGAWVTVTMNGQVVSWQNEWSGQPTNAPQPDTATTAAPAETTAAHPAPANFIVAHSSKSTAAPAPSSAPVGSAGGAYSRQGYYDSESQTAQGVTFLNHMGGQGSGVFDYSFGNSLSYASADASSGSASSQILQDMTIPSNNEIVLLTDSECSGGSCGYVRPGTVAYHGFNGASKIFLFEFSMPSDGTTGFNADMPAIWLLNAQIPLTLQYGNAQCSCWSTGCGEFDIMEVLDSGDTRCKSTLHGNISGGDSAYIERPTGSTMKLAVVMSDSTATIKVLDDSFDFSSGLSQSQVDDLSSSSSLGGLLASLFALGS